MNKKKEEHGRGHEKEKILNPVTLLFHVEVEVVEKTMQLSPY